MYQLVAFGYFKVSGGDLSEGAGIVLVYPCKSEDPLRAEAPLPNQRRPVAKPWPLSHNSPAHSGPVRHGSGPTPVAVLRGLSPDVGRCWDRRRSRMESGPPPVVVLPDQVATRAFLVLLSSLLPKATGKGYLSPKKKGFPKLCKGYPWDSLGKASRSNHLFTDLRFRPSTGS